MTERSRFWNGPADGSGTGDASEAEYDAHNEFAQVVTTISGAGARANKGGVSFGERSNYAATVVGGAVRVQPGTGICDGTWHDSDANVDVAIPTPAAATRVDYLVLRKDEAAQTVRITRAAGAEGAGVPALTQTATVWDVPLWQASITTGGAITLTDARQSLSGDVGGSLPVAINIGDAGTAGVSSIPSSSDHEHPFPDPASGPPAFDFGVAAAEGVATTPARSDHTHETPKLFRRRKSADTARNLTASPTADPHLTFPVLNGEAYIVDVTLFYDGPTTGDLQVNFSTPGGSSLEFGVTAYEVGLTTVEMTYDNGSAVTIGCAGTGGGGNIRYAKVHATVVVGADGNVALTWAQAVSDAGLTTLYTNSSLVAFEI